MAQFFKPKSNKKKSFSAAAETKIKTLQRMVITKHDHAGNGLCLTTQPLTVVDNALVGEECDVRINKSSKRVNFGSATHIVNTHPQRTEAFCQYYAECGGCSMQHTTAEFALGQKEAALRTFLHQHHDINAAAWQAPIRANIGYANDAQDTATSHAYRRRIRLAVDARNPQAVKLGFRKRNSNKVIDITHCPITLPAINQHLSAITARLKQLPSIAKVGHVIITAGSEQLQVALAMIKPLCSGSAQQLSLLADTLNIQIVVLHKNQKNLLFNTALQELSITVIDDLQQHIAADQFLQVNPDVNKAMLVTTREWLSPSQDDCLYDFFCGSGNFSLSLARHVNKIYGFEGVQAMVTAANNNANMNSIDNCEFASADLSDPKILNTLTIRADSLVILDPSREGAEAICHRLTQVKAKRIVYVSCNPNSLMRDLGILRKKYTVQKIAALDMFPFTKHLEVIALLTPA